MNKQIQSIEEFKAILEKGLIGLIGVIQFDKEGLVIVENMIKLLVKRMPVNFKIKYNINVKDMISITQINNGDDVTYKVNVNLLSNLG